MWCNVECCNFRHGVMWYTIEILNVCCGIWHSAECGILVCRMLHNARCDVEVWNCGDEECGICKVLWDCCVMSDVENDAMCCDVRCGGVM